MHDISDYGYDPSMMPVDAPGVPARVTAVYREQYEVVSNHGISCAKLKPGVYYNNRFEDFPTAGDFVSIQYNPNGVSLIVKTLIRKSKFARNDFSGHAAGYVKTVLEQVVAANFDYVFIMASLNNDLNIRRIERYLALAWQSGAVPVVILSKADLVPEFSEQSREVEKAAPGVCVRVVSAKTRYGMDGLEEYLKPRRTIVFLGSSGVGKSSLVNALAGEDVMKVNAIREDDSRGRHTTTHRQLIMLKRGVMIIDTPGMRELGMWEADTGISEAFGDVEAYLGKCRFTDCGHRSEPGCAIKAAIASGELSYERWNSYLSLAREARFSENKAGYLKDKEQFFKSIAKRSKQIKK